MSDSVRIDAGTTGKRKTDWSRQDWKLIDDVRITMICEWLEDQDYSRVVDCTDAASPDKVSFSKLINVKDGHEMITIDRHRNYERPTFVMGKGRKGASDRAWVQIMDISEDDLKLNLGRLEARLAAMLKVAF